jgi:hypothetical protein
MNRGVLFVQSAHKVCCGQHKLKYVHSSSMKCMELRNKIHNGGFSNI